MERFLEKLFLPIIWVAASIAATSLAILITGAAIGTVMTLLNACNQ